MSKKTPGSPMDVVTALMQERVKFEAWLAALDQRRDATPANVYQRVHRDYETRLASVLEELKTHARELEEQAERFTARLAELTEREQELRDERAEAELRAHVGELSEQDWTATAKQADDALAAIAAEQAVAGADLNRVHDLLGAATSSPVPAAPVAPVAPAAEAARPAEVAKAPPVVPLPAAPEPAIVPPQPDAQRASSGQSKFDELAFLKSVVSPYRSSTPVEQPKSPKAVKQESPPDVAPDHSEALTETLVSRAARQSQERAFVRDDGDAAADLVGRATEPERLSDRPFAANVTGNNPIVLRPSGAIEQPKTLKCGECGAMNYPTEWYCERCGAELASL